MELFWNAHKALYDREFPPLGNGARNRLSKNPLSLHKRSALRESVRSNRTDKLAVLLNDSLKEDPRRLFSRTAGGPLYPLEYAIQGNRQQAALMLARHVNSLDFKRQIRAAQEMLRITSALHPAFHRELRLATKKGMTEVVHELLLAGADPNACLNEKSDAMDLIVAGSRRKSLVDTIKPFTTMEAALAAQNAEAVATILARTLWSTSLVEAVELRTVAVRHAANQARELWEWKECVGSVVAHFKTDCAAEYQNEAMRDEAGPVRLLRPRPVWPTRLKKQSLCCDKVADAWASDSAFLEEAFFEYVLLGDLDRVKKIVEAVSVHVGKPHWVRNVTVLPCRWSVLHAAAAMGHFEIAQYLLQDCQVDPLARTSDGEAAVELVFEGDDKDGKLRYLLKVHTFAKISTKLLTEGSAAPVTDKGLRQLLGQLTSVQDLQLFFTLGGSSLTREEMHALLRDAFGEVISEKLVFDDGPYQVFKQMLRRSRKKGFMSRTETSNWKDQATKVHMESAEWVRDMKRSLLKLERRVAANEANISALHKNFCALREALIQKEKNEILRAKRERIIGLVTGALVMVGGPAIGELLGAVLDAFEPAELLLTLTNMSVNDLEDFLTGEPMECVFKTCVTKALKDSSIKPVEFAVVLRDVIKLERADRMRDEKAPDGQKRSGLPSCTSGSASSGGASSNSRGSSTNRDAVAVVSKGVTAPAAKVTGHFLDVVRRVQAHAAMAKVSPNHEKSPLLASTPASTLLNVDHSWISDLDLGDKYPFHCAVQHSEGALDIFQMLATVAMKQTKADINATLACRVKTRAKGTRGSSDAWESMEITPLMYTSYLGYTDILQWFLDRDDVARTESKMALMARSMSNAEWRQATTTT